MNTKITSAIERIKLDAATFSGEVVVPTLINFFYGNNGTGKSTIARAIGAIDGLTWQQGNSNTDYNVLIYNQEFVEANFQGYGNLKGVFTVGEHNIEIQNQIAEKTQQKIELDRQLKEYISEKNRKETEKSTLLGTFQENCWDKVKNIREGFKETQCGYKKSKAHFAERVLQSAAPTKYDVDTLKSLYDTAFDANARAYSEFQLLGDISKSKAAPGYELLGKPIISSGDTPFANFIKAINATDWVRHGHDRYTEAADGRCPYCQQKLPADFESQISACFDAQYQKDLDSLRQFQADYLSDMQSFINVLKAKLRDSFPKLDLTEYRDKLALLEKMFEINFQRIADKIKKPSSIVSLESVEALSEELNALIAGFNRQIYDNNSVVNAKKQKQAECITKVWELIAYMLQSEVSAYKTCLDDLENGIATLSQQLTDGRRESQALDNDIASLNRQTVSTKPAIDGINRLLRDSGFQGFSLREKIGQQNVYEVIREDGMIATNLSDGERNFIAFLYFYHLVRGSYSENDTNKDKIIVIDDPVSSMGSSGLFIISALVREMVEICFNNADYLENRIQGDYIKQIFVLTHNPYFHTEITLNQIPRYKCVSFFVVSKTNNISSVKLCEHQCVKKPTEKENYNPVQNFYAELWSEYKEADTTIMVLNVIRRILEYYFIQISGYNIADIRKKVLEDNKDKFVGSIGGGQPDYIKYHLASAMFSYINANAIGVCDGLNYVDDCTDVSQYKAVFKLIFETLQQDQHYRMMMDETE